MNSFLGMVVLEPLGNQKTFAKVVKQITHHLHAHQSQIKLTQTTHLIQFQALHNTNTFSLPKQDTFVHTCHHRISFSLAPTETEMSYFKNVLECILIMKEHFPSKIEIQVFAEDEHLQACLDREVEQGEQDLSRRHLSYFRSLAVRVAEITQDQVNDVLYIMRKADLNKLISLGLSILKKTQLSLFQDVSDVEVRTLEQLQQNADFEKNAEIVLAKIKQCRTKMNNKIEMSTKQAEVSRVKFDEPTALNSWMFQFKESNNLERLAFLVQKISTQAFKLEKDGMFKADSLILNTIERLLDHKKIDNSKQCSKFVDSVLKYFIFKKQVSNWENLLDLLYEILPYPTVTEGIKATLQVFMRQFQQNCDAQNLRQLERMMGMIEKRLDSEGKENRNCIERKGKLRMEENCMTARGVMGKSTTKSKFSALK